MLSLSPCAASLRLCIAMIYSLFAGSSDTFWTTEGSRSVMHFQ